MTELEKLKKSEYEEALNKVCHYIDGLKFGNSRNTEEKINTGLHIIYELLDIVRGLEIELKEKDNGNSMQKMDSLEKYMGVSISTEEYKKAFELACEELSKMSSTDKYTIFKTKNTIEAVVNPTPIMWSAHLIELAKENNNG